MMAMEERVDVRAAVRERYGAIAEGRGGCGCGSDAAPGAGYASQCCGTGGGGPGCCGDTVTTGLGALGYTAEDAAAIPEGANLGLGCGNPIALAEPKRGDTVLDLGSGGGIDVLLSARRVGPTGKVFANDVQPQMLQMLAKRLANKRIENVTLVQGALDDPKLAPASVDLEIMVDVYHEFSQPQAMLRHLREALKPGGRLVLLEYRKEDPAIPIRFEHKMSIAEAKMEVEAEGFTLAKVDESLPRQHILIFTVTPSP